MKTVAKITAWLLLTCATGVAFGILPCYLFPLLGADPQTWCGHKSEPRFFWLQLGIGLLVGGAVFGWLLFRKRK